MLDVTTGHSRHCLRHRHASRLPCLVLNWQVARQSLQLRGVEVRNAEKYAAGLTNMPNMQNMQKYVKYAVCANHATNMQNMHRGLC